MLKPKSRQVGVYFSDGMAGEAGLQWNFRPLSVRSEIMYFFLFFFINIAYLQGIHGKDVIIFISGAIGACIFSHNLKTQICLSACYRTCLCAELAIAPWLGRWPTTHNSNPAVFPISIAFITGPTTIKFVPVLQTPCRGNSPGLYLRINHKVL